MRYSNVGEFLCPTMESGKIISIFPHLTRKITICVWAYASLVMSHMQQLVIKKKVLWLLRLLCQNYSNALPQNYSSALPQNYSNALPQNYSNALRIFGWTIPMAAIHATHVTLHCTR